MFRSTLPILLFLLLGSASAGALFVKNPDGTFTEKIDGYGISSETVPSDSALENYEETVKLRYSDLPLVEKSLKKDIFLLIAKNEDYMAFLNHPSHKDLFVMINNMTQGPNQAVLQEQIWKKVLAIEAYYEKFVEPLDRPDTIEKAMKLLMRLVAASAHGKLTVEDTVELDQNLETIAFLLNRNLTQRLVSMLEDDLHPVTPEHKRSHHMRKSSVSETSTRVPSSNQTESFVIVPPPSLGRKEKITDIYDSTIYTGPKRPMPFTNNNGTKIDVYHAKPSEDQAVKNASNVDIASKLSDVVLDRPRNFPFNNEIHKFVSGNSEDDNATSAVHPAVGFSAPIKPSERHFDDPTIYIGPRRPMPFTSNNGTKVDLANVKQSEDQAVMNASNVTNDLKLSDDVLDRPRNFPFNNEIHKFVSGNSEDDNATSAVHPAVGFSAPIKPFERHFDDPTIYIGPRRPMPFTNNNGTKVEVSKVNSSEHHVGKNASNVNQDLKLSDDVLDKPRNFPFNDEIQKFVSGNSEDDSAPSTSSNSSKPTETRMAKKNHSGQETTNSSKTHMPETTTMAPATRGMRSTRSH